MSLEQEAEGEASQPPPSQRYSAPQPEEKFVSPFQSQPPMPTPFRAQQVIWRALCSLQSRLLCWGSFLSNMSIDLWGSGLFLRCTEQGLPAVLDTTCQLLKSFEVEQRDQSAFWRLTAPVLSGLASSRSVMRSK